MTFNEIQNAENRHITYLVKAYKERKTLSLDALNLTVTELCFDSLKFDILQRYFSVKKKRKQQKEIIKN